MARATIVSAVAANPQEDPKGQDGLPLKGPDGLPVKAPANVIWKIGDPVPGNPELIVRQLVLFNGGVTVFAVPSSGSKTELEFIQHTGTRQGFIFNLAASTVKMTVAMASADAYEEIRRDTYDNADDNFDEDPDVDVDEEEEEEEEADDADQAVASSPMVAPAPAPSFLPSAESVSDATTEST